MIAHRFQSFQRLVACTVAVMGLYMITSQVASERTELERVDRQILSARKDIRQLQTELGTRASLRQLERWNGEVLALSTPDADQFIASESSLATLDRSGIVPGPRYAPSAVVMAMASAPTAPVAVSSQPIAAAAPAATATDSVAPRPAAAERREMVAEAKKPAVVLAAVNAKPKKPGSVEAKKPKPAPRKPIDLLEQKLLNDGLMGELASRAKVESGGRTR